MSKRCPPGVICIENITVIFVIVVLLGVLLYINKVDSNINIRENVLVNSNDKFIRDDKFILDDQLIRGDPYIRNNPYMQSRGEFFPITMPTQPIVNTGFQQVGILTRIKCKEKETILPLMGRPLYTNGDKWNYYTMNDSNNIVRLPITFKGRSCMSEYGCDNLYDGDIVFVDGYNDAFKVTAYDNQVMRYIPFTPLNI